MPPFHSLSCDVSAPSISYKLLILHSLFFRSRRYNMVSETRYTTACFFGYGLVHSIPRVLLWMAIEDIISGTLIQSSVPTMLFSLSEVLFRFLGTFMARKTSSSAMLVLIVIADVLAFILLVAVDQTYLRIAGAFFVGVKNGLSVVVVMFLVARFPKVEESSSAFQVGANAVTLFFALVYTGK